MKSPDQRYNRFNPAQVGEETKRIETLQTRINNLYKKFGIDRNEKVDFGDNEYMSRAVKPGSKEWVQERLGEIDDMIHDASVGSESAGIEERLANLEQYMPEQMGGSSPEEESAVIPPDQRFDPFDPAKVAEAEKYIGVLQTRLADMYKKFGIDPNEEVDFGDNEYMLRAVKPGSKEWAQKRLGEIDDMINDAGVGKNEYIQKAEDALKSLEEYKPTK